MPSKKSVELVCHSCSSVFLVESFRKNKAKFCSVVCRGASKRGHNNPRYKNPDKNCYFCSNPFKSVTGRLEKFCSRVCYENFVRRQKKCKDCGKERCREHARLKTSRDRSKWSKQEKKAKSMQTSFRAASDGTASLSLEEARRIIDNPPVCPYCCRKILWNELSIDHKTPKSRGGSSTIENLVWTDLSCNMLKGNLTEEEYRKLLKFIDENPELRIHLTTRLKAGGGFIYGRKL